MPPRKQSVRYRVRDGVLVRTVGSRRQSCPRRSFLAVVNAIEHLNRRGFTFQQVRQRCAKAHIRDVNVALQFLKHGRCITPTNRGRYAVNAIFLNAAAKYRWRHAERR